MTVKEVTDKGLWDKFVDDSPYGLLFHKWDALKIMEKYSGYCMHPLGIYKGNELICLFPLFHKKHIGMKSVFSPPPRLGVPYLGFVMSGLYDGVKQRRRETYLGIAIDDIHGEIAKLAPNYVSILTVPGFNDIRPFKWNGYNTDVKYTYTINLEQDVEAIWKGFDDNCKKSIKQSAGYDFTMKEDGDATKFHEIMVERYRQQNLNYPPVSAEYLNELLAAYPDNLKLYYLYHQDKVVGIELICKYKKRLMLWMGESVIHKDVPANYYMRWHLIKAAKEEGFKVLEIEGANTKHLCLNKSRFNPELSRNFCIYKKDTLGVMAEWTYQNLVKRKAIIG